jgi:RNA polymerase sigma-70 factor (ECF subfamily)
VNPTETAGDGAIVRAVLAGDVERYGELIRRHRDRLARYAAHVLGSVEAAEDALQDAFVRAFDQLRQCRDPERFAGWLFLILRNRCFAERRHRRQEARLDDPVAQAVATGGGADTPTERDELRRALQRALLELTPEQREVFVLKHVEELSYEEIAARTGETVGALKMRMHRGYDRLRDLLREHWT